MITKYIKINYIILFSILSLFIMPVSAASNPRKRKPEDAAAARQLKKVKLPHEYIEDNNYQEVASLLEQGANPSFINPEDPSGERPLDFARCPKMVRLLLKSGAAPHIRNSQGGTILHKAAFKGRSPYVLAELCQTGLDVNLVDRSGDTALHDLFFSTEYKEPRDQIKNAAVLCWYGGNLTRENRRGEKPLDLHEDKEGIQYDSKFAFQVRAFVKEVPAQKEKACKQLAVEVAPSLDGIAGLGSLVADYAGAPGLSPAIIDTWDELV